MNQTTHQMRLLGCESKAEFEEANSLALVKFMALEIEQKLQETNDWEFAGIRSGIRHINTYSNSLNKDVNVGGMFTYKINKSNN